MKSPFAAATMLLFATAAGACAAADMSRHEEIARKGSAVMPFDLARTTHFFDDDAGGGTETITANEKGDAGQVALIRSHLAHEASRFAQGDFSDPARIHGHDMPGIAGLSKAGATLHVSYRDVPDGASITFASRDPALVAEIHRWFAAQRSDHAAHGRMHGM